VTVIEGGLHRRLVLWWRRNFQAVPRLVRVSALIGGVVAVPVAVLGVFAGDLVGVAAGYVAGDNGVVAGTLIGFLGFAGSALLGGAWIGAQIGKWLIRLRSHHSN
jgi:hypothetical protein